MLVRFRIEMDVEAPDGATVGQLTYWAEYYAGHGSSLKAPMAERPWAPKNVAVAVEVAEDQPQGEV